MLWLLLWVIRCEDGDQSLNADILVNTVNLSTSGWILANLIVLGASGSSSTRISLGLCFLKGCSVWWLIPTVNSRELRYTWAWIAHIFGCVWRPLQRGLIEAIRCTLVASDNFLWVGILGQIKRKRRKWVGHWHLFLIPDGLRSGVLAMCCHWHECCGTSLPWWIPPSRTRSPNKSFPPSAVFCQVFESQWWEQLNKNVSREKDLLNTAYCIEVENRIIFTRD